MTTPLLDLVAGDGFVALWFRRAILLTCVFVLGTCLCCLPSHAQVTATWNGTGNWSDPNRWSTFPLFPDNGNGGNDYNVIINGGTATLDQDIEILGLTFSGGTINGDFDLELNSASAWSGGTMGGSGVTTIADSAELTMNGASLARQLVNEGTTTWSGGGLPVNSATIENEGSFIVDTTSTLVSEAWNNTSVFNNSGTFSKQGTGTAIFQPFGSGSYAFNNSGTVDVQQGLLRLSGGGTHTGDFTGDSGTSLEFRGNHNFAAGADITGGVNVMFYDTSTLNSLLTTTGTLTIVGGTINFNDAVSASVVNLTGGTANFNSTLNAPIATISGGYLGGSVDWNVNSLTWTAGGMFGTGTTAIASGGTLLISQSNEHYLERTLVNEGTTTWSGGGLPVNSATIENEGNFIVDTSSTLVSEAWNNTSVFNNSGTFSKQGTGTTVFQPFGSGSYAFNNSGTVDVQQGGLRLAGGGSHTGDFTGGSGTSLEFRGNHNFSTTSEISGGMNVNFNFNGTYNGAINTTGSVTISGGTNVFNGTVTAGTLNFLSSGFTSFNNTVTVGTAVINGSHTSEIRGSGDIHITDSMTWTSGQFTGTGTLIIESGATLSIPIDAEGHPHLIRTLVNHGVTTLTGNGSSRWFIADNTFQNYGTFIADSTGGTLSTQGWLDTATFNNFGTYTKVGPGLAEFKPYPLSNPAPIEFNNYGTVHIQEGTLRLTGGGTGSGEFIVDPGANLELIGNNYTYSGGVTLSGGTLQLATFALTNGTVQGNGTIDATTFTNASEVAPGLSFGDPVGAILVDGAYEQTTNGNLSIDVEGTIAGEFDTLDITGDAELGGTLTVALETGHTITPGQEIEILTAAALNGSEFDDVITENGEGIYFAPVYELASAAIYAYEIGDMNRDFSIDANDISFFALALNNPSQYSLEFGISGAGSGDANWDGILDFDDIEPFVAMLPGTSIDEVMAIIEDYSIVPEPSTLVQVFAALCWMVCSRRGRHA